MLKIKQIVILLAVLALHFSVAKAETSAPQEPHAIAIPVGSIDPRLLPIGYSGQEKLVYDVFWTGGIKIGELHLEVTKLFHIEEGYQIKAVVTTKNGAVNLIYPIKDVHVTQVRGPNRLPYHYEIRQNEGYSYKAHRVIEFDQEKRSVRYTKNEKLEGVYPLDGETNNEFSSFFNSRLMPFAIGDKFVVPTFADKKRMEVLVHAVTKEKLAATIFGSVTTMAIMPILTFKGLYDKKGDTVIYYTDDECRVPVRIISKIIIGSLTADLTAYENPACKRYPTIKKKGDKSR
jgi:hypothetical protein